MPIFWACVYGFLLNLAFEYSAENLTEGDFDARFCLRLVFRLILTQDARQAIHDSQRLGSKLSEIYPIESLCQRQPCMLVSKNAHRRHQHLIAYQLLLGLDMEGQSAYRLEKGVKLFDLFRHIDVLFEAHTLEYQLVEVFLQNDFDFVVYCRSSLILTVQRVCERFVGLETLLSFRIELV